MSAFLKFRRSDKFVRYSVFLLFVISGLLVFTEFRRGNFQGTYLSFGTPPPRVLTEVEKIKSIRRSCGILCDTSRPGIRGPYFNHVTAPINCKSIFHNPYIDEGHTFKVPPKQIPVELWDDFTMGNRLNVSSLYFSQMYLGFKARTPIWTKEGIDESIGLAAKSSLIGNYGTFQTNELRDGMDHAPGIRNGRVLVIGSENPWAEAAILEKGANTVVTVEYGRIISKHRQVKTMVPSEFRASFLNGSLGLFDAVVTYSSVEHSGLGRYGDRLNPWGDIIAIARAWCVTKVNGSLTVGVPYDNGKDYIQYNAHRVYGKIRYPYLSTNWRQHYRSRGRGKQRVHVFTKVDPRF